MGNQTPRKLKEEDYAQPTVDLGFAGLDTKKLSMLADVLEKNTVVRKLCLGWNDIGDLGAERLALALQKNKVLKELILTENGITHIGAEKLAAALQINSTLEVLDLMNNRIGDKGAGSLSSMLAKNQSLKELRLYDTGIEYTGASRLMNAAERNNTLLALDLRFNDINDRRLVIRMEQCFARNRGAAARQRDAPLAQRGDLELYIFSMREKITSVGEYGPWLCEPEREGLREDLLAAEVWLQSHRNESLEEYRSQLAALKEKGDVVAMRHQEGLMRGQMMTAIYSTIANYRASVESSERSGDESDIPPEKKVKILNACKDVEQWLTDMRQAQEHLPNYERPVLLCADMVDKNLELANMVAELMEDTQGGGAEALKEVAASSARGPASARGQASGPAMAVAGGNERKGQLLSYISQLQTKIAMHGEFGAFVSDAERERLDAHLVGASVWASQTASVPAVHYIEKLQELRSVGDVIEWRCDEDSMRHDWIAAVSSTIANCRNAAKNPGDRYEKISEEKFNRIMSACTDLEDWLQSMQKAQHDLAKYERPVLLCADMERRNLELARFVGELLEESRNEAAAGGPVSPSGGPVSPPPAAPPSFLPPPRVLPTGPEDDEDGPTPPPPPADAGESSMPALRGHTPRIGPGTPRGKAKPKRGRPKSPTQGGPRSPRSPRAGSQPRSPRAPPEPGQLRDAGAAQNATEDERILELDALDAACSLIVDEDEDAPMPSGRFRQVGR